MIRLLIFVVSVIGSSMAIADDYECRSRNEVRTISVEYEHKGWQVPCKVKYEKPSQGVTEYPWNAQATAGYCEDRAEFLAGKLENWGWICTKKQNTDNE